MARQFKIPELYHSKTISALKQNRKEKDRYKKDMSPAILEMGPLKFKIARHFGFCFGVENAIETAYKALEENPNRRIFLLSQMIHNYRVNADMESRGIRFLQKTDGTCLIPFTELNQDDIVIIPAFGTTVELLAELEKKGVETKKYNTTCPFVERVWNRSRQLGRMGYTIIIHGDEKHEETKASFSHACLDAPAIIIRNLEEAKTLGYFIQKKYSPEKFHTQFSTRCSQGFSPERDLVKIGVVNQTTMLAVETQRVADYLKKAIGAAYPKDKIKEHFADTRDTLCYATTENQEATNSLLTQGGDFAIVVGSYNSSNTSHLVELLEKKVTVYYIQDAAEILDPLEIRSFDLKTRSVISTKNWMPKKRPLEILITAGASCPDALVEEVIQRIADLCSVKSFLKA